MAKTLEIVFGNSCAHTMQNSDLREHDILMFNALFGVGDLSQIDKQIIGLPAELRLAPAYEQVAAETKIIIEHLQQSQPLRVWAGHQHLDSYLLLLYVASLVQKHGGALSVVFCDEIDPIYQTPGMLRETAMVAAAQTAHQLAPAEIASLAATWDRLVQENGALRIIENGVVKSVSLAYYDRLILDTLQGLNRVRLSRLVANLMAKVYLQDVVWVYLINRLIATQQIKIDLDQNVRYFDNFVEIGG